MVDALHTDRPPRWLVTWSRVVTVGEPGRYREETHTYCWPCATLAKARKHVQWLVEEQADVEGGGHWGTAIYGRPPLAVRIRPIGAGERVDIGAALARATARARRYHAEDKALRDDREREEKRRRLEALKRELGED